jgi:hypothetical protein
MKHFQNLWISHYAVVPSFKNLICAPSIKKIISKFLLRIEKFGYFSQFKSLPD